MSSIVIALRNLARRPGLAGLAVIAFGLGIALVTTQYSLIDGVLLRTLPLAGAERLVHLGRLGASASSASQWQPVPMRDFLEYRAHQAAFEELAAYTDENFNLSRHGQLPKLLRGSSVSDDFFTVLGAVPAMGRTFRAGESAPGQPALAVLGYGVWQREFGGDPAVLGRSVHFNGESATVVGVMPAGFQFPARQEVWVNLRQEPRDPREVFAPLLEMVGRLKPGVSVREAAADASVIAARLAQAHPETNEAFTRAAVQPIPFAYAGGGTQPLLYTMLAMTLLVLLLACTNVTNLLVARAAGRVRETAIRAALGAGRRHLLGQVLVESLLLAAGGAVFGLLLSWFGVRLLDVQVARHMDVPFYMRFDLNWRVVAVAMGATALAGVVAGFLPAWRSSRVDLAATLHDQDRGGTGLQLGRLARGLVVVQLALACALVVAASFLALSVLRSRSGTMAFNPDHLLLGRIELHGARHPKDADRVRFYRELVDRVAALPGVAAVAVSSRDLAANAVYSGFERDGQEATRAADEPVAWLEVVSHDYFRVVEARALQGRLFDPSDHADSPPVALVNASFARRYWPGEDPIGKRIRRHQKDARWATVIGVVPDLGMEGVGNNDPPHGWYLLQDQQAWGWLDLLVRTEGAPEALIPAVRQAVSELDPDQPIHSMTTLRERAARRLGGQTIVGTMTAVFALAAVVLAGVGVYGVTAFAVNRRTREFGIRLALGSSGGQLQVLLVRQASIQLLLGLGSGLVLAYLLTLPLAPYLAHVSLSDPTMYTGVAAVLAVVALASQWVPARRASRVDPLIALRAE